MRRLLILTVYIVVVAAAAMAQSSSVGTGKWLHDQWLGYHRFQG